MKGSSYFLSAFKKTQGVGINVYSDIYGNTQKVQCMPKITFYLNTTMEENCLKLQTMNCTTYLFPNLWCCNKNNLGTNIQ